MPDIPKGVVIAVAVFVVLFAAFVLVVNLTPHVPNVSGRTISEATSTITSVGFEIGDIVPVTDYDEADFAVGEVVRTRGGFIGFARAGSTIAIDIAAGPVIAVVNGQEIRAWDLERKIIDILNNNPNAFAGDTGGQRELEFRKMFLASLIDRVLVEQAAEQAGITVEDSEIDAQITLMRSGFDSEEAFIASIRGAGLDMDDLREQVARDLLTEKLMATLDVVTEVTDKDVETFFANNASLFPDKKLEDVRAQVYDIIVRQRRADAYQDFVVKRRDTAEIEIRDESLAGPINPQ